MALGASPHQVRRMVVIPGMKVALVGVILGAGPSLALARLMKGVLYGVNSWDPVTIIFIGREQRVFRRNAPAVSTPWSHCDTNSRPGT